MNYYQENGSILTTEPYIMDIIKQEQDFNVSLDYLSENEDFQ